MTEVKQHHRSIYRCLTHPTDDIAEAGYMDTVEHHYSLPQFLSFSYSVCAAKWQQSNSGATSSAFPRPLSAFLENSTTLQGPEQLELQDHKITGELQTTC